MKEEEDREKRERNKAQERKGTHGTAAHPPLTDIQPGPKQWLAPPSPLPPVYILGMTLYGIEYPFVLAQDNCSGHASSQFLLRLVSVTACKTNNVLDLGAI